MTKTENKYFIFDCPKKQGLREFAKDILYYVLSAKYSLRAALNHPGKTEEKKYNVSIVAIFKNEAPYLKEWIEFNHLIGIDHFYLYNNNSEDDFQNVLQPYVDSGLVTLNLWEKNQAQMECYQDGISRYRSQTKWIGFIDIDEFIVPVKNNNIYDFLKPFEKNRGAVLCYWRMFCSGGLMDRDRSTLVTESFTVCWPKWDTVGKCFYNTNYDIDFASPKNKTFHHIAWPQYKGKIMPPVNADGRFIIFDRHKLKNAELPVQINHYFTKSFQEYKEKKAKGDVYFKINPHDEEYFYRHDRLCTGTDFKIFRFLVQLKQKLGK